ncbi:uncharacterized protein DUF3597 [Pseudomonas duriflava]|uniref:Uncharacterized protein DUF3597 n=1 Tax=Pseudomonas duriflava TaxID=459528 RepID=A0A562PXV0_9PSED|nr:DUF3597 domain-containing protein [Pseudomonas duriflava]TWI49247.1 uncharacterized protein DUF3597 [Pseudomonas duriflava]
MGLFNSIMEKLGVSNEAEKPARHGTIDVEKSATEPMIGSEAPTAAHNATTGPGFAPGPADVRNPVDLPTRLDSMAANRTGEFNWRTSIVDLLKLLDLDSSLQSRKELATELGCPPEKMNDSEQMNIWLHKAVMQKLAEHDGTVPPELKD